MSGDRPLYLTRAGQRSKERRLGGIAAGMFGAPKAAKVRTAIPVRRGVQRWSTAGGLRPGARTLSRMQTNTLQRG
jgi:hypothetical protein